MITRMWYTFIHSISGGNGAKFVFDFFNCAITPSQTSQSANLAWFSFMHSVAVDEAQRELIKQVLDSRQHVATRLKTEVGVANEEIHRLRRKVCDRDS